jgi:signal transduction histidine kinase
VTAGTRPARRGQRAGRQGAWHHSWQRGWSQSRHSLGVRLVALFVVLALAMSVTFVVGMQAALRHGWQDYAGPLIANYIDALTVQIGTPPDVAKAQALTQRLPLRIRIEGPSVNWSSHPDRRYESRVDARHEDRPGNPWRPARELADGHRISFGLAATASRDRLPDDAGDPSPEDRPRLIGWATLATLLLLIGLAYAVVRRLLRPLADIRAGAVRYGEGDFSTPIRLRHRDELGDLADRINRMAEALRDRLEAKRALLLAISHELRSPLTRARLNAELVDDGPARDALLRDLAQMRDLIADLLESERLATGHAVLHTAPTDLNALVNEACAAQIEAGKLVCDLANELPRLPLDPARIRLLLRNLVENAVRHSADAAVPIALATSMTDGVVSLVIRDHGPGVDEAQIEHLAQAFYRPDTSRQRGTGGVGLGLYLCRLVAAAHGGTLSFRNAHPGLEVTLRLPLAAGPG